MPTTDTREKTHCKHCGCHKDNWWFKCLSGRHSYTEDRAFSEKNFPFPILTDYKGNIIKNGKHK